MLFRSLAVAAPVAAPAHAAPDAAAEPPPLVPISSHLVPNIIGQPELLFTVRQSGTRTIDGMQFRAELFNNFNDPVMHRIRGEDNVYVGESDERLAPRPRAPVRVMARWTLHSFDTATKAIVTITRVHFTDGSSWEGAARQEVDPRIPERAAPGR